MSTTHVQFCRAKELVSSAHADANGHIYAVIGDGSADVCFSGTEADLFIVYEKLHRAITEGIAARDALAECPIAGTVKA